MVRSICLIFYYSSFDNSASCTSKAHINASHINVVISIVTYSFAVTSMENTSHNLSVCFTNNKACFVLHSLNIVCYCSSCYTLVRALKSCSMCLLLMSFDSFWKCLTVLQNSRSLSGYAKSSVRVFLHRPMLTRSIW